MASYPLLDNPKTTLILSNQFYHKPKRFLTLLEHINSIEELIHQFDTLNIHFRFKSPEKVRQYLRNANVEKELQYLEKNQITVLSIRDEKYPKALKEIADPPPILYAKGNLDCLEDPAFAVVGPRNHSNYGGDVANFFCKTLTHSFCIVSGFAKGIDSIAHTVAVSHKRPTIAVMGVGLDQCYPKNNISLAKKILDNQGLLLSEVPLFNSPNAFHFPLRNRIISGLSRGVLLCEAKEKSGSLITAHTALEQNKEVFAVPGNIFQSTSKGCHSLIQDGAKCTTKISDIYDELQLPLPTETQKTPSNAITLNDEESQLINILTEPKTIDALTKELNIPLPTLLHRLTFLEIKQQIKKLPGNLYAKVHT